MPQLDLIVYYPQFFWFSLGFSLFYLIVLYRIIPVIAFSLKFRKKKLLLINNLSNFKGLSSIKEFFLYYDIVSKILKNSRLYLIKVNSQIISHINFNFKNINLFLLKQSNNILIQKLVFLYLSSVRAKFFLI